MGGSDAIVIAAPGRHADQSIIGDPTSHMYGGAPADARNALRARRSARSSLRVASADRVQHDVKSLPAPPDDPGAVRDQVHRKTPGTIGSLESDRPGRGRPVPSRRDPGFPVDDRPAVTPALADRHNVMHSGLPIMAGGPLRARPRPPLSSGPKVSRTRPGRSRRSLGRLYAPTVYFAPRGLAQISSARGQKNGRQHPSPKGITAMTDTITADPGYGTDSQDGPGGRHH
jgi:hypothetical protein